ncbi:nitronate monooxygenase [Staphylococcus sp. NRL 16/872]|uniref:NAD(P)H-dependent flavin oxidoreductase n=1 Tax=Staphylococcus sp. NRL 16/872 TaxID=2930131 RepID=UPI001FB5078B|nr:MULTISPECIES: nitronate monooxygenase [unclassified Staphylococcus]MCJ1662577.1 nitronate monooxygenase [Staphylococcus sp. NRL 18/288]MCJ1668672.1 nitronate monooxygenase [Staphylococcus sp. NRL 19/737]WEN68891.1 nitronate monooxygenase [Staphylococcus sp. NRL 16/872]
MRYDNQLTQILKVQYPIIQAGMAGSTTPELVASVSNKGALGTIGAGYMSQEKLEEEIQSVKALTTKPFGVNLFVPGHNDYSPQQVEHMNAWLKPYRRAFDLEEPTVNITEEQQFVNAIDCVIKYQVPVCCFTFGIPERNIITKLKQANVILVGTATTVEEAIENERAGMDVVVAQGSEAGGHRGSFLPNLQHQQSLIGTMSLVPQMVDSISIPVVAAGGIMDGRGIVASLVLGAQGVQMGTAFLTAEESGANDVVKQTILNSKETDTVVTNVFSGKSARGINNEFVEAMMKYEGDIPPYPVQNQLTNTIRKTAASNGNKEWTHIWSGQSPRLATAQHVDQLMDNLVKQIEELVRIVG